MSDQTRPETSTSTSSNVGNTYLPAEEEKEAEDSTISPDEAGINYVDNGEIVTSSSSSAEALAKAISSTLSKVIEDFDSKAADASKSQDALSFSIDRLTKELDQLLEDAPLPFIMQYAAKITSVRKRVSSLNSVLRSVQRRLDNIDRTLCMGSSNGKPPQMLLQDNTNIHPSGTPATFFFRTYPSQLSKVPESMT